MRMEFKKYWSLENTYKQAIIDRVFDNGLDTGEWVVEEKLDGANFQFFCNGETINVASRNQFVDGTFFNCQAVINEYADAIVAWCKKVPNRTIRIYGELYGARIQNRVNYGDTVKFAVFDILIGETVPEFKERLVSVDDRNRIANEIGIPLVPELFRGSLDDALAYENTFRSRHTPDGHEGDNIAEGTVIKPNEPKFLTNGSRVVFKNKNAAFSENGGTRKPKVQTVVPDHIQELLDSVSAYINNSRVKSVLSKEGNVSSSDFGRIMGAVLVDAIEDYESDNDIDLKKVVDEHWKTFTKALQRVASAEVREEFKLVVS